MLSIIVINLLGGLGVGVMQQGLSLSEALLKYSLLTIGDGMVAQIPALLAAMAAGLIVTRASSDERDRHLGEAIGRQLAAKPRVLVVAGGLCFLLALVPGFPWWVFGTMALVLAGGGALLLPAMKARWQRFTRPARETMLRRKDAAPTTLATAVPTVLAPLPLVLRLAASCSGDERTGVEIVQRSLAAPVRQIAANAGADPSVVVAEIKRQGKGYNALTGTYEDLLTAGSLDAATVGRLALQGAVSRGDLTPP